MRKLLHASVLLALIGSMSMRAAAADKFKRIAVMPFENTTQEKALDWIGGGIAELLTTDLGKFSDFTLVERGRLNDALKEIKLGQSASVDPATAQKMGKILGADSIVVGSFQKFQDDIRIVARVIEVETAEVRTTARVDGAYKNLLSLQNDIAAKLVEEMKGSLAAADKKKLEALPSKSLDAVQALSDGTYFLRNDLIQDALKQFDRAIALDPNFTEAHYYRGVALKQLKQWDEAIASLKRTLPRTQNEQRVKWSWDAPFEAQAAQRGLFLGVDLNSLNTEAPREYHPSIQKRFAYTERSGKNTVLHFVDLTTRNATRVQIPDDSIPIITGAAPATDLLTLIPVATPTSVQAGSVGLYAISPEGGVLWHEDLKGEPGKFRPEFDLWDKTLFEFYSNNGRIVARDAVTLQQKWERADLIVQSWNFKVKGGLALVTSPSDNKIHALRLTDGADAWTFDYSPSTSFQLLTDRALIVFEPDRRVFALDLATGKMLLDVPSKPLMLPGANPYIFSVPALVQDNVLYFVASGDVLTAVDLNPTAARVRWQKALQGNVRNFRVYGSQIYASAQTGEFFVVDKTSGSIKFSKKVADRSLSIVYAGDDTVLATTNATIQAFDPKTGNKQWEYANLSGNPGYFKGVVLVRPSIQQIALLDAATGGVVWQYAGSPVGVWVVDDSIFVLEANGVKEYALDRNAVQGITNKEAMTELASVLLSKGDLDEAARFADRVAREADPNYPPLRYVQAQLNKARGNAAGARRELLTYTDLVGRQSKAGQEIIAGLKRSDGLVWNAEVGGQFVVRPEIVDGKVLSGGETQVAALDAANGKTIWRQNVERLMDVLYVDQSKRVFYVHGQNNDPTVTHIYTIGIDGNGRKELVPRTAPSNVNGVFLAQANNRLFAATLSVDRQSGRATLNVAAFNAESGVLLWEKNHVYAPAEMAQIGVAFGLFYPRGDFLVYSSGKTMWVIQASDGSIYDEHREDAAIAAKRISKDSTTEDPDITHFVSGTNDVVAYRFSSKQVIFRTPVAAQDPAFSTCACLMLGTTLFNMDGSSIVAFDLAPGLNAASRLKWRLAPAPGQQFSRLSIIGDSLGAVRASAGVAGTLAADATFLRVDPASGKILNEVEPLWAPITANADAKRFYAFTPDGMAYAMDMK